MKRWRHNRLGRFFAAAPALLMCLAASVSARAASTRASGPSSVTAGPYSLYVQPDAHLSPVLQLIRHAQHSVRLEVYLLTSHSIVDELKRARERGVDVRVILEEHPFGADRYARLGYSELQDAGVPVRWANEAAFTFTHEKSMEVDDTTAGIFTFNFTSSGFLRNREFGLIERSPADARALGAIFDTDWNRQVARYTPSDLVVSPYNSRRALSALIDSARHTLDLYAEEVNDSAIESHLSRAVRRGVQVRLIVPASSTGVDALRRSGVAIKLQPQPYVHAKVIVADGRAFFLGSENVSTTSLDRNREVGILLHQGNLAAFIERVFAGDWGGAASVSSSPPSATRHTRGGFHVTVAVSPRVVSRDERLTIAARTRPGASCTVRVLYPSGHESRARSLRSAKTAGTSGTVTWSLLVGTKSTGTGKASVGCTLGSLSAGGTASFVVQ